MSQLQRQQDNLRVRLWSHENARIVKLEPETTFLKWYVFEILKNLQVEVGITKLRHHYSWNLEVVRRRIVERKQCY